ncbi:MAG: hypothetical protein OXH13_12655 [Chloroflexi bacterium]|nr:hypothetical protein [Chloroflexota bacterium]MCY3695786.1 hypothetical protein [Chloroflexota bacterium]MXX79670.1 hypothetical protein [Chloroflexota bacterium]MYB20988.1 hypothetical protein [Chloroflexota bacterium]MYF22516.1 hypothetical protein [Chloroflexota bacterium]
MSTMRRRRQFKAELWTTRGSLLTECFAIIDIETTRVGDVRERSWRGKLSSLSNPEHSLGGVYQLRPRGESGEGSRIDIVDGFEERLGVTSDEYSFIGSGDPPHAGERKRRR